MFWWPTGTQELSAYPHSSPKMALACLDVIPTKGGGEFVPFANQLTEQLGSNAAGNLHTLVRLGLASSAHACNTTVGSIPIFTRGETGLPELLLCSEPGREGGEGGVGAEVASSRMSDVLGIGASNQDHEKASTVTTVVHVGLNGPGWCAAKPGIPCFSDITCPRVALRTPAVVSVLWWGLCPDAVQAAVHLLSSASWPGTSLDA